MTAVKFKEYSLWCVYDIVIGGRGYNAWLKGWEEIDFETVSNVAVREIQQVIQQIILCMR